MPPDGLGLRIALLGWPAAGLALGLLLRATAPGGAPWVFALATLPVLGLLLRDILRGLQ